MRRIDLRTENMGMENHHLKVLYAFMVWNASSGANERWIQEASAGRTLQSSMAQAGGSGAAHRARTQGVLQQHAERKWDGSDCES